MIQYFEIDGKEYPFLLANRQLRRFLGERKLKVSEISEVLLDMDALCQLFLLGVSHGMSKEKRSERVTMHTIDDWNESGQLPFKAMIEIVNNALSPNFGGEQAPADDAQADYPEDPGN